MTLLAAGNVATVDRRRYNAPTTDEIAGIIPDDNLGTVSSRDIVVRLRDGPLKRLSEMNAAYDGLHFVLMHPFGEGGWHAGIPLHAPAAGAGQGAPEDMSQEVQEQEEDFRLYSQVM